MNLPTSLVVRVVRGALVLSGTELIFFIVACMVLCFGFVLKTVLITHQCSTYC